MIKTSDACGNYCAVFFNTQMSILLLLVVKINEAKVRQSFPIIVNSFDLASILNLHGKKDSVIFINANCNAVCSLECNMYPYVFSISQR